jgi:hypothetical protein
LLNNCAAGRRIPEYQTLSSGQRKRKKPEK